MRLSLNDMLEQYNKTSVLHACAVRVVDIEGINSSLYTLSDGDSNLCSIE